MAKSVTVELYDPGAHPPQLVWTGTVLVNEPGDTHTLRVPALSFTPRVVLRYPDGHIEDSVTPACAAECGPALRAHAATTGMQVRVSATPPPADQPAGPVTWVMCEHQEVYLLAPAGVQHDAPG